MVLIHYYLLIVDPIDSIHCIGGALKSFAEKVFTIQMAVQDYDYLGRCSDVQCCCQK